MPIPRPPKAVTFDCWSTLIVDVDWDATTRLRQDALVEIAASEGIALDPERAIELIEGSWEEHVRAWRDGKLFGPQGAARWCLRQLGMPGGDLLAGKLAAALEDATRGIGTRLVEGAGEAIEAVRAGGVATALVCDTGFTPGRIVREFLNEHGLVLDHYFFSDEVGTPKPYAPIFEAALSACRSAPEDTVHIGDLRRTDIAGARAAGMATIRFAGVHDDGWTGEESQGEEADAVLKSWPELPALLGL